MRVTCSGQLSLVFGLSVYTVEASAAAPLWGGGRIRAAKLDSARSNHCNVRHRLARHPCGVEKACGLRKLVLNGRLIRKGENLAASSASWRGPTSAGAL